MGFSIKLGKICGFGRESKKALPIWDEISYDEENLLKFSVGEITKKSFFMFEFTKTDYKRDFIQLSIPQLVEKPF